MTTAVPPVVTDPASRYPELARLRAAAASGDLETVLAALDALRDSDPDEYAELSSVVVLEEGLDAPLEQHLQASPDDRGARTLWAHRVIAAIEGGELGDDPAARIREAEHWLQRMCAEDPTDPHPWTLRLATSRLLGLGAVETRRRYGRLLEARPDHVAGQRWMLDGLGPRHGGSWDEALAFARRTAAQAPPGSPAGTLVVAAHLGRWVEESAGGTSTTWPDRRSSVRRRPPRTAGSPGPSPTPPPRYDPGPSSRSRSVSPAAAPVRSRTSGRSARSWRRGPGRPPTSTTAGWSRCEPRP